MIISTQEPFNPDFELMEESLAAQEELRTFEVPVHLHGQRLDRILVELVSEFSRSYLQQLADDGAVLVNGVVVRKNAVKLRVTDRVAITLRPTPQSQAFRPQAMDLEVVHQDAHLMVINKPPGLVVHPAAGHWSGTLLNGLLALDAQCAQLPRAGIVHRLDKDTSGLMVVARTRLAMDALVALIAARAVSRQYIAIGQRAWRGESERRVDEPIGRDVRQRLRMAVVDLLRSPGKEAMTDFYLLQNSELSAQYLKGLEAQNTRKIDKIATPEERGYCLLRCILHTGRTHQIRVHAAHIGHPLVADSVYGGDNAAGLTRQALHAQRLAFRHPMTGEELAFSAPLPADLQEACQALGLRYNEHLG